MLILNNIEVIYSNVILVLKGVSMELGKGSIAALLGANGAGKTTTLKAISGLLYTELGEVTEGSIEFNKVRIDKIGPEKTSRMGIIQVMEGRKMFEHFTVEEELKVGAYASGDGGNWTKGFNAKRPWNVNFFKKLQSNFNKKRGIFLHIFSLFVK